MDENENFSLSNLNRLRLMRSHISARASGCGCRCICTSLCIGVLRHKYKSILIGIATLLNTNARGNVSHVCAAAETDCIACILMHSELVFVKKQKRESWKAASLFPQLPLELLMLWILIISVSLDLTPRSRCLPTGLVCGSPLLVGVIQTGAHDECTFSSFKKSYQCNLLTWRFFFLCFVAWKPKSHRWLSPGEIKLHLCTLLDAKRSKYLKKSFVEFTV